MALPADRKREEARQMTERQKRFVDEYILLKGRNQTQAAINAGYSPKTAYSIASENMKKPEIQDYLAQRKKELEEELRQSLFFDAVQARDVMARILEDPQATDRDKLTAARDFLDRAGFGPVQRQEITLAESAWFKDG